MAQEVFSQEEGWRKALYDVEQLRRLQQQIAHVRASTQPALGRVAAPRQPAHTGPLLLLPGAFNPPTIAHLALAEAALQASESNALYFVVSTATINKEHMERAALLDRLLLLELLAQRLGFLGVLVTNRGLYVEQAEAAYSLFGTNLGARAVRGSRELRFVIGFDKIVQIFDPRYYTDREAALQRLFTLAHLLVAPRASHEASDVATLMQQPENQQFQPYVHLLPLPADFRDIASSQVRAALQQPPASGTSAALMALLRAWLPPEVILFCEETGCYASPVVQPNGAPIDHYGLRWALLERALALPEEDQQHLHLRALFHLAVSDTPEGQAFRDWLSGPAQVNPPQGLLRFQRHLPAAHAQQER